jgi:hypothetical protein
MRSRLLQENFEYWLQTQIDKMVLMQWRCRLRILLLDFKRAIAFCRFTTVNKQQTLFSRKMMSYEDF